MGLRIAFCLAVCLWGARITDAKITQIASLILRRGGEAQLTCKQNDDHNNMYWYQQKQGQGLKLISYSIGTGNKNVEQGSCQCPTPELVGDSSAVPGLGLAINWL
ncbi:hypothetical protein Y1Q_0015247 [Alligator mississippiensis]|uniref:Immunoglobulin V-set domain-containing protein n=1 Tax=Alligator mississippiensis TaxID=8496 RepID=A0A151NLZ4_ALLMI|nr:hypothetical protein Y1Q_0015247 [Alligator mississippiensis]